MTLIGRPAFGRPAALALLVALAALFCVGPLAAYCRLIGANADALADRAAVLQRYRALGTAAAVAPTPTGPALLYPDMPESQASALLQETVKNTATAAHVQVQGLQVLRSEAVNGATRIGVKVRASGDMTSLRNLIYAIETARPVLYADNLSIQSHTASADPARSMLDFQFDVSGFTADPAS